MKAFKLDEHPKIESGFRVPDGYFEKLSEKVEVRIAEESKVIPIHRKKTWLFAAAAVLVAGLGITVFNALSVQTNRQNEAVAIENYLAAQSTTEDLLVEALEKEDIDQLSSGLDLDDQAIEDQLSDNINVEQYLID